MQSQLWLLLMVLWFTLNLIAAKAIERRKFQKISRLLTDECDLVNYTAIFEKLSRSPNIGPGKTNILLCLSSAYLMSGNNQAAGQVLSGIKRFSAMRVGTMQEIMCHNNRFVYFLRLNDIPAATHALSQMEKVLQSGKLHEAHQKGYTSIYKEKHCQLRMALGDYNGCEEAFEQAFSEAENTMQKVAAKYALGKIYLHYDRITEATEAFKYAVRYGGSSIYMKKSVEYLNKLGAPISVPPEKKQAVKVFSNKETAAIIIYLVALFALVITSIVYVAPRLQ